LTSGIQRVINLRFALACRDRSLISLVGFYGKALKLNPAQTPTRPSSNTPSGFAVEACSEFQKPLSQARLGVHTVAGRTVVRETGRWFWKAVPKHV
jgi:hypothetical protein